MLRSPSATAELLVSLRLKATVRVTYKVKVWLWW